MFEVCKLKNKGSATVETTFVMVIITTIIIVIMYAAFFLHDYTVVSAQVKYNLMIDDKDINSILFMGEMYNRSFSENNTKRISKVKLKYYIPLLGTNVWNIDISDYKSDIDKIRRIKVYKDGINKFKQDE